MILGSSDDTNHEKSKARKQSTLREIKYKLQKTKDRGRPLKGNGGKDMPGEEQGNDGAEPS